MIVRYEELEARRELSKSFKEGFEKILKIFRKYIKIKKTPDNPDSQEPSN